VIEIWGYLEAQYPHREVDKGALINLVNVPEIQVFHIRPSLAETAAQIR
jgi:hypothetical protein